MKIAYIENIRLPTERAHGYQVMKTCEALSRAGVSVELVTAARQHALRGTDPFAYYNVEKNFAWREVLVLDFMPWMKGPLMRFAYWLERASFLSQVFLRLPKADAYYTRDVAVAAAIGLRTRKPLIVELHDDPRFNGNRWQKVKARVNGWVVISEALKRLLEGEGITSSRILTAHDAFDEQEFSSMLSKEEARRKLGIEPQKYLLVYLGQLFPWKGIDSIASAFRSIPEDVELAIVGGYPDDISRIKKLAGDAPNVRFVGQLSRQDSREWLAAADGALLSTSAQFEIGKQFTSPLKLFEYLAAGLPVLASDVVSSREILDDQTAIFFRPDNPHDFLHRLNEMRKMFGTHRQKMGETARQRAAGFTWTERGKAIGNFLERQNRGLLIFTQVVDEQDENLAFFTGWIRRFAESGRPIYVACWKSEHKKHFPPNVHVIEMPKGKIQRMLALLKLSWRVRNEVQSVFVHMIAPVVVACGWFWRVLGFRVVLWYTHGNVPWELRVAEKFVDKILTASDESLRLVTPKKVVTGHGIDLSIYHPLNVPREPMLLTVGRISPRKDQISFVKLCARVRDCYPDLKFHALIVGDPRLKEDKAYDELVKKEIVDLQLQDIVERKSSVLGMDLVRLYSQAALFVSTSETGSVDKVVLEAMACETQVLPLSHVYQHIVASSLAPTKAWDRPIVDHVVERLRDPKASQEARHKIQQTADLDKLIHRIESFLYA